MPCWAAMWSDDEVAVEDEVEELGEFALALGLHDFDPGHDLAHDLGDEVEAPHHLRVLVVVAQLHQRDQLTGDVAVLAPPDDLVVAQLGVEYAPIAGAFAFSLTWPCQRVTAALPSDAGRVEQRERAADALGQLLGRRSCRPSADHGDGLSCATAESIQPRAPGNSPTDSSTSSGGIETAPMPPRGCGEHSSTGTYGRVPFLPPARAVDPDPTRRTSWRRPSTASDAASIVSSVLPEYDTAMTNEFSVTNAGSV